MPPGLPSLFRNRGLATRPPRRQRDGGADPVPRRGRFHAEVRRVASQGQNEFASLDVTLEGGYDFN